MCSPADDLAVYIACHVYASVDPRSSADGGLRRCRHPINAFPGYRATVDTNGKMIAGLLSRQDGHCRTARAMRVPPRFTGTVRSIWLCLVEPSNCAWGFTPPSLALARICSSKRNRELHVGIVCSRRRPRRQWDGAPDGLIVGWSEYTSISQ